MTDSLPSPARAAEIHFDDAVVGDSSSGVDHIGISCRAAVVAEHQSLDREVDLGRNAVNLEPSRNLGNWQGNLESKAAEACDCGLIPSFICIIDRRRALHVVR